MRRLLISPRKRRELHRRAALFDDAIARIERGDLDIPGAEYGTVWGQVDATVWGQVRAVYDPSADPDDPDVHTDPRLPGGIRHEDIA